MKDKLTNYVLGLSKNAKASNSRLRIRLVYHLTNLVILYFKLDIRIRFTLKILKNNLTILKNNLKISYIKFKIFFIKVKYIVIYAVRIPGGVATIIFLMMATLFGIFPIDFMRDISINMLERRPLTFEQKKFLIKMQDFTTHATWVCWIIITFFYWRSIVQ